MTLRRCLTILTIAGVCASAPACATVPAPSGAAVDPAASAAAALKPDPFALLGEQEVSLERIKTYFDAAFLKAEIDRDGDLKISEAGLKSFMHLDEEKRLLTLFSLWELKASVPETAKLRLANAMNEELIFVRFAVHDPTTLWCEYQFLYEGGITPYAIVGNYRLFAKVVKGAVREMDPDGVIGSD